MMKKILVILAFLALWPCAAYAASFTATVDSTSAVVGQGVTLQLTLSGASAQGGPETGVLGRSFDIAAQGETSSTTIINGAASSSVGWQYTLLPKKAGTVVIPPVSIATSDGTLKTAPITLNVASASAMPQAYGSSSQAYGSMPQTGASGGAQTGGDRVYIHASVNRDDPYENQPVSYTVRVVSGAALSGVSLQPPQVSNAIVKEAAKPKVSTEIENGARVNVVTFRFLVTPVGAGKISIPAAVLQGDMAVQNNNAAQGFGNFFTDPFQMLQNMNNMAGFGFASEEPFTVASNAVTLSVRPPVAGMNPWLPLSSLRLSQHFDMTLPVHVGDPVTRKIVLLADGLSGSQLPDIASPQNGAGFSVYAGKPKIGKHINGKTGDVSGWRQESYSLIPQKAGKLVVPALKVTWWNTRTGKAVVSTLPQKTIDVLPAVAGAEQTNAGQGNTGQASVATASVAAPVKIASVGGAMKGAPAPRWLYALIAAIVVILLFVLFWALSLQRKISRLVAAPTAADGKKSAVPKRKEPAGFSGVDAAVSAEGLKNYIQSYAHDHWGTPANAPLETVFAVAQKTRPALGQAAAQALARDISATVYAGKPADLADLKARSKAVLRAAKEKAANGNGDEGEKLSGLNPS